MSCEFCGAVLGPGATTCGTCGSAVRVPAHAPSRPVEAPFQQLGSAVPSGATCAVHPGRPATFICKRCGSFACPDCTSYATAGGFCQKCSKGAGVKAGRGTRLAAHLIDNAVVIFLPVAIMVVVAIGAGIAAGKGKASEDLVGGLVVLGALGAFVVGCGAQVWAQVNWGQSIGKRAMKIKVVRTNGDPIEVWRLILMRNALMYVIAQLCGLVGIVDAVLIFAEEERCLHDYIADTIVVVAE